MLILRFCPDCFGPLHHTPPSADAGGDEMTLADLGNVISWRFGGLRRQVRLHLRDWRRDVRLRKNRNVRLRCIWIRDVRHSKQSLLLSSWRRHVGHVIGLRIPVVRWGAVFRNGIKLWKLR